MAAASRNRPSAGDQPELAKIPTQREFWILDCLARGEELHGAELNRRYGAANRAGKPMPLGSLYVQLARVEDRGLIRGGYRESTEKTAGHRRRYYRITAAGASVWERFGFAIAGVQHA